MLVLACCHFQSSLQVLVKLLQTGVSEVGKSEDRDFVAIGDDAKTSLSETAGHACEEQGSSFRDLALDGTHKSDDLIDEDDVDVLHIAFVALYRFLEDLIVLALRHRLELPLDKDEHCLRFVGAEDGFDELLELCLGLQVDQPVLKLFDCFIPHGQEHFIELLHIDLVMFQAIDHRVQVPGAEQVMRVVVGLEILMDALPEHGEALVDGRSMRCQKAQLLLSSH